jgi:hypothetical protein
VTKALALIVHLVRFEISLYRSLTLWILRRPRVPKGATAIGYVSGINVLLWAFIVVSAVELVAFHVILPWEIVRLIVDIVSAWGLIWMLGYAASLHVYPHLLTEEGIRVRHGTATDILVPWQAITDVRSKERGRERSKAVQYDDDGATLNVVIGSLTNIDLTLTTPIPVSADGATHDVVTVRFRVDHPREFVNAAREALRVRGSATSS